MVLYKASGHAKRRPQPPRETGGDDELEAEDLVVVVKKRTQQSRFRLKKPVNREDDKNPRDGAVATLISNVTILPNSEIEFDEWVERAKQLHTSKLFPGFVAFDAIPNNSSTDNKHNNAEFMLVVRYRTNEQLWTWLGSPERQRWIQSGRGSLLDPDIPITFRLVSSSRFWFNKIQQQQQQQPRRPTTMTTVLTMPIPEYHLDREKMTLVSFLVYLPLMHFLIPMMQPQSTSILGLILWEIITVLIIVLIAQYIGFPFVMRVLACCLFPSEDNRQNRNDEDGGGGKQGAAARRLRRSPNETTERSSVTEISGITLI